MARKRRYEIIRNMIETARTVVKGTVVKDFFGNDYEYQNTLGNVSDDFKMWENVHMFPAVYINSDTETFEGFPSRKARSSFNVMATVYERSNEDLERRLSEIVDDILVAMFQDVTRGTDEDGNKNANHTMVSRIDMETRLVKPYGIAEMYFTVVNHFGF